MPWSQGNEYGLHLFSANLTFLGSWSLHAACIPPCQAAACSGAGSLLTEGWASEKGSRFSYVKHILVKERQARVSASLTLLFFSPSPVCTLIRTFQHIQRPWQSQFPPLHLTNELPKPQCRKVTSPGPLLWQSGLEGTCLLTSPSHQTLGEHREPRGRKNAMELSGVSQAAGFQWHFNGKEQWCLRGRGS